MTRCAFNAEDISFLETHERVGNHPSVIENLYSQSKSKIQGEFTV